MEKLHANIDFSNFPDAAFDEACGKVKNQLTTNATDFPALIVGMPMFGTHLTAYRTIADKPIYPEKTTELRAARLVLESDIRKNGVYVNTVADGDEVLLVKSGYPISKAHAPVGALAKAVIKKVVSIPNGFEVELEKVPHAIAYLVCVKPTAQVTTNDYKKWPWYNTSKTKLKIDDLDSGVKYTIVAVAIGSDPTLTFSSEEKGVTQ